MVKVFEDVVLGGSGRKVSLESQIFDGNQLMFVSVDIDYNNYLPCVANLATFHVKLCNMDKIITHSIWSFGLIYSGAKKYLVSHQLCKFSHLKI